MFDAAQAKNYVKFKVLENKKSPDIIGTHKYISKKNLILSKLLLILKI